MASTILIKFYRFVVLSTPNNVYYQFPEKSMILENYFFIYLANISSPFSVFERPLKLRVVQIRKKLKISIFSKMAPTILIIFCEFIVHSKPSSIGLF